VRFEPHGATTDPEVPEATSIVDWIVQRLILAEEAATA
jgi:hypothetical protein